MTAKRLVVVVYGGAQARPSAVSFCEKLVQRFWTRFDFTMKWWSFDQLGDGCVYQEAAQAAAEADIIAVAAGSKHSLPSQTEAWIEAWLILRKEREGTLACVVGDSVIENPPVQRHLRKVAHRAGMDFLTDVPEQMSDPFADSLEVYTARAKEMTSFMDHILKQPRPPALP